MTMHGEITKRPFGDKEEKKHFQSANMQMGRVQLDSDWNEAFEILLQLRARAQKDIIGRHGSPNDGFRVDNVLILDHLESKDGWIFSGNGSWKIEHSEKVEGKGSFKISGEVTLTRQIPELLKQLSSLKDILVARGANMGIPRLLLHYKVSSADNNTEILFSIEKDGGGDPVPQNGAGTPVGPYSCNGWQFITFEIPDVEELSEYNTISIKVKTTGDVYFDSLAIDPGLLQDNDFYIQGGDGTSDSAGRYYVDGLACIKEGFETYYTQMDYPEAQPIDISGTGNLAYLDVWKRTITVVEDPDISEVALGGPDTCTREQLVSQVKVLDVSTCIDFSTKESGNVGSVFQENGFKISSLNGNLTITENGLQIHRDGIQINLPQPCTHVTVQLEQDGVQPLQALSYTNDSNLVSEASTTEAPQFLEIKSREIGYLIIKGGNNESLLVKICCDPGCNVDIESLKRTDTTGTLTAKLAPQSEQAECDFKPELDYTGLNNSLYRIEIYEGGDHSMATFKWSRNNGADLVPILSFHTDNHSVIVPDDRLLCCGDWVELCDDVSDLADFIDSGQHGKLARIIDPIEHMADGVKITLDITTDPFNGRKDSNDKLNRHPKLRKWHGVEKVTDFMEKDANNDPTKELEHGIRLVFSEEHYYHGDYWQFTARINTREIEELDQSLPHGPTHHYAPLSVSGKEGEVISYGSCRKTFPPLTDLQATDIRFDPECCSEMSDLGIENVQQAIEMLCKYNSCCDEIVIPGQSIQDAINRIGHEGGSICLSAGVHIVTETILIKNRKNIIIKGDGSATRVIYLPDTKEDQTDVLKELKERIEKVEAEISKTDNNKEEELKKLNEERNKLRGELFTLIRSCYYDLFQITSSENITLENFLMFSSGSDSLAAILEDSKEITISDCDILNIISEPTGFWGGNVDSIIDIIDPDYVEDRNEISNISHGISKISAKSNSCIRMTNCCEMEVNNNRIAGSIGLLQQGDSKDIEAKNTPLINGLKCVSNRFHVIQAGIALIEGIRVFIDDNDIYPYDMGWEGNDYKKFRYMVSKPIVSDEKCPAGTNKEVNNLIDDIIKRIFGCTPEMRPSLSSRSIMIMAFILRTSRIERNKIVGGSGISIFYSRDNEITSNRITCLSTALRMTYNFKTKVKRNTLETFKIETGKRKESDAGESDLDTPAAPGGLNIESSDEDYRSWIDDIRNLRNRANRLSTSVIEHHFSDRLIFKNNKVKGMKGLILDQIKFLNEDGLNSEKNFIRIIQTFAAQCIHPYHNEYKEETMLLLVKRFVGLMGLDPIINLFETILGLFSGGKEVDMVKLLFRDSGHSTKNPFVKVLLSLFKKLLDIQLVSRTVISGNRFEVESFGIKMVDGITMGGVRIMNNRFSGAKDTAILWKAHTLFSNPELNGFILSCGHKLILYVLKAIKKFLNKLISSEEAENTENPSPFLVLIAVITLYGISRKCDCEEEETGGDTPEDKPEKPYEGIVTDVINALDDLIDQLDGDEVQRNVSDLASSHDRISHNQIRGTGNGIHTNIANTLIESNRIDVEPGKSAIAELFSIGRYIVDVLNIVSGAPTALLSLGRSLMNIDPNALETSREMLSDNPGQLKGLSEVLETAKGITKDVKRLEDINKKIDELIKQVSSDNTTGITVAFDDLINELKKHLIGYGMILESPGMHVLNNRVEAAPPCGVIGKCKSKQAPGGILMTADSDKDYSLFYLLFSLEEIPLLGGNLFSQNIGGQGTLFSGNSLQWGTGHGLSLLLPLMADVKIENNEIQNHGLAGIHCDGITIYSLPSFYNFRIIDNEINQCFRNKAYGLPPDQTPGEDGFRLIEIIRTTANILGGIMVRNTAEINCSRNNIGFTGNGDEAWPAYGTFFFNCHNVMFEGNKILENGQKANIDFSKGGVNFLGGIGNLIMSNNSFIKNVGNTMFLTFFGKVSAMGNIFEIDDDTLSNKINIDSVDIIFSQNQVSLLNTSVPGWKGMHLSAQNSMIFNGNIVTGNTGLEPISLAANKGIATGNVLYKSLIGSDSIIKNNNVII